MPSKHRHHKHAGPSVFETWIKPALQFIGVLLLASMLKYEWTLISQCTAEDEYEHSHNLMRLAHAACNEDFYIWAGVINCENFRRAVDPAIRAADKAECWWNKHVLFNSWTSQLVLLVLFIWCIKLLYSYFLQSKRYEFREREKSHRKAALQLMDRYEQIEYRAREARPYGRHHAEVFIEEID